MRATQKYPLSMIVFHALIAIGMVAAWLIAQMDDFDDLIDLHRSIGASVLILALLRLVNRLCISSKVPVSVNTKGSLKYILEKSVHGMLYLVMLALPLLGWLLTDAYGGSVSVFGWFNLPNLMSENLAAADTFSELHELAADVFVILLLLHIAGALVHLFKNKDNIFKRMTP